jgi:hypothetical protein
LADETCDGVHQIELGEDFEFAAGHGDEYGGPFIGSLAVSKPDISSLALAFGHELHSSSCHTRTF